VWWGGFEQLNWFARKDVVLYGRYDWISGESFDDTAAGGTSRSHPLEWDVIAGLQFLVLENLKFIGEYRHHAFDDRVATGKSTLTDDGFTLRAMTGF
jgi:opacity protein-like surface antigen